MTKPLTEQEIEIKNDMGRIYEDFQQKIKILQLEFENISKEGNETKNLLKSLEGVFVFYNREIENRIADYRLLKTQMKNMIKELDGEKLDKIQKICEILEGY